MSSPSIVVTKFGKAFSLAVAGRFDVVRSFKTAIVEILDKVRADVAIGDQNGRNTSEYAAPANANAVASLERLTTALVVCRGTRPETNVQSL